MDAIRVIKAGHQNLMRAFDQYESGSHAESERQRSADQFIEDLKIHLHVEEQIFYPAIDWAIEGEDRELLLECLEDQRDIEDLIIELDGGSMMNNGFDGKFLELGEKVRQHIDRAERELLPLAEKSLEWSRDELGTEMERLRTELERMRAELRPTGSDPWSTYMAMPE